jgi:hypothetical protein
MTGTTKNMILGATTSHLALALSWTEARRLDIDASVAFTAAGWFAGQ